jgi:hypothetical protein
MLRQDASSTYPNRRIRCKDRCCTLALVVAAVVVVVVELVVPHMVAVVGVLQLQLAQVHRRNCKSGYP